MPDYPNTWTEEQCRRFAGVSEMLGIDGLWAAGRFIHVCGTNGKGSVCAFLSAILRKAGYRVGLFTSPHLYSPAERISIDGEQIEAGRLDALIAEARQRAPQADVFEHYMYAALHYFAGQGTDIDIIEAGIGGAMDCTNIVRPVMCVCANIGLDHTAILGDDILDIARQKAGIAKPGVAFVAYPDLPWDVRAALLEEAGRQEAMVFDLSRGQLSAEVGEGIPFLSLSVDGLELERAPVGLQGMHQAMNGATAAYAAWLLNAFGMMVKPADIAFGLVSASWPGRMELLRRPGKPELLLDGAHNLQAATVLRQAVEQAYPGRRIVLLTAIMRDKPYEQIAAELDGLAAEVVCTRADEHRGLPAEEYARFFHNARHVDDPGQALLEAERLAGPKGLVLACGSLYLPALLQEHALES